MSSSQIQSDYLERILDVESLHHLVDKVCNFLVANNLVVDTAIAAKGFSSIVPSAIIAYRLKMNLILVRSIASDHSTWGIEGNISIPNYLIIDDITYNGDTLETIINGLAADRKEAGLEPANLKAIIFYGDELCNGTKKYLKRKYKCIVEQL